MTTLPRPPGPARAARAVVTAVVAALVAVAGVVAGTRPAAAAPVLGATVTPFGDAVDHGALGGQQLAKPVIAAARTASGNGYWLAATDGGIFTFGDARFFGSTGSIRLNAPIVGMAATPSGEGYWLVAKDGGIFTFGDAHFLGSTGAMTLNEPIVGMAAAPSGEGYWLVARDGGIFAFGDARFLGSTGAMTLNEPIVGMAATPSGEGYWLVAEDGGLFAFGDAGFHGSTGALRLLEPITAMASTPSGGGYWLVARDGGVFAFGDAGFQGRVTLLAPDWGVFALVPSRSGGGYWQVAGPDPALPTLQRGDTGEEVEELQRELEGLGYWLGGASGRYERLTEQAVMAFQKVEGLPRTGRFDGLTRAVFENATRPAPRSTAGDLVEVDKARQVLFLVRDGLVQWVFNTSTGTEGPYVYEGRTYLADTPEGMFRVSSAFDGLQDTPLGVLFRPRYFHPDGIAVHGSPSVPSYPASHGCVRVTDPAINWIWANDAMPFGSTVWVY